MKQSPAADGFPKLWVVLSLAFIICFTACSRPHIHPSDTAIVEPPTATTKPVPINLNTATAAELESLPGVGPMLAARIITYREENGRFRRAEHLMMVRGISDRKFRELRPLVRVE